MKMLELHQNVIDDFEKNNRLNKSETRFGLLFWLTDDEIKMVNYFESQYKVLVYHVIKTETVDLGTIYDLLYVTEDDVDMQFVIEKLNNNIVLSYSITPFPEKGFISIKKSNDGLVRCC